MKNHNFTRLLLGDILEVVNTEDDAWWQAKKYGSSTVGLVPSHDQR